MLAGLLYTLLLTYISLEIRKLQPTRINLYDILCLGGRLCLICSWRCFDRSAGFSLSRVSSISKPVVVRNSQTLQFLHRQTKFASPRLPDWSFISCRWCQYLRYFSRSCVTSIVRGAAARDELLVVELIDLHDDLRPPSWREFPGMTCIGL